jgi:hypothetical protein
VSPGSFKASNAPVTLVHVVCDPKSETFKLASAEAGVDMAAASTH